MARRTSASVLGQYRGRVGPVVFSSWMDLDIVKPVPKRGKHRKKQNAAQIEQSEIFSKVNYLLSPVRSLIDASYQSARKLKKISFNAAVSEMMINAVIVYEDKRFIDFSRIKLSKPAQRTEQIWDPVIKAEAGKKITVSWELNSFPKKCTRMDDQVKIAFCSKQNSEFRQVPMLTARKDLSSTFKINTINYGHEIFIYVVVISADGKLVAESDYLGSVTVID